MIMKRSVVFLALAAIGSAFFSCEKANHTVYTIKGRLLKTCDDPSPFSEQTLILTTSDIGCYPFHRTMQSDTCITDGAGYFELQYIHLKMCEDAPNVDIFYDTGLISGINIIVCIPKNENVDLGNVYLQNRGNLVVTIHPGTNSYTDQDTLRIEGAGQRIAGPFTQTIILDTIKNVESYHGYQLCKPDYSASDVLHSLSAGIWRDGKLIKQFETGYVTYCEQVNHVQLTIK
jgi:hypothetical protein